VTDYAWPLQQALYTALTAASPAIAGGRIYDQAPDAVEYPWVQIDGGQAMPDDLTAAAGTDDGIESYVDLHVWSRYGGQKECLTIGARLHDVLHGASLAVTGRASAHAWIEATRGPMRDPDGLTRHLVVTVKIIHRS